MELGMMLMSDEGPDGRPMDCRKNLRACDEHGVEMVDLLDCYGE